MLLCSYRCRHGSIPAPAPTRNGRTKWTVSERLTVKELGTDAAVPVYFIRQTLFLSLLSEIVVLYSDPLTPVLSHVASSEVIKVGVGKPWYVASDLNMQCLYWYASCLALERCKLCCLPCLL